MMTSCSTSYVTLKETRKHKENLTNVYNKVLVVGIASPKNTRQSFENIFVDSLQRHGVAAVASHKFIADLSKASQDQIQALAQQEGADAVAVTRVLSKSEHTSYKLATGHVEYRTVAKTTTTENSSTTVAMSGAGIVAGEMDSVGTNIQTNFFDAATAELLWTAVSHAAGGSNDKSDICWELSFALSKALGEDNLINITVADVKMPKL